jgi:hypothetical protein
MAVPILMYDSEIWTHRIKGTKSKEQRSISLDGGRNIA